MAENNVFMNKRLPLSVVYILLLSAVFFWGVSFVFSKIVLQYMDAFSILFFRLLFSSILLIPILLLFYRQYAIKIRHIKFLALLSFFEPFLYFIGETFALQRVSPTITALVISTIPVFTAISVFFVYKIKLLKINVFGIILSFLGVFFLIFGKELVCSIDSIGLLFLFLAVFSAVCYGLVLAKIAKEIHPVWITALQNIISLFLFLPLVIVFGEPIRQGITPLYSFISPQLELWGSLIILAVFCSTLAFIFYAIGVKNIGVAKSNVFSNLIPIFTAITSFILLNEAMTANKIIGMIVIIVGVALAQLKKKQQIL